MNFVVNQEKKRTWNYGWWRDWMQGRVMIGISSVSFVVLVVTAAHLILSGNLARFFSPAAMTDLSYYQQDTRALTVIIYAFLLAFSILGSCMIFAVLRHRNEPCRQLTNENLIIENGILTLCYHRRYDPTREGVDVACARLSQCAFWWDAKRRQLVIDAKENGAIREWHYPIPMQVDTVPFEQMRACSFMRFYPYYDPDLIAVLRSLGVEERGPRSTFWEV